MEKLKKVHIGKNIESIRELKKMKQEVLAAKMNVSQQTISRIEQSELIDDERLEQIAQALEVTPDAIKNFNADAAFNVIGNNYFDNASSVNYQCTFNPIDKIVELYERLLKYDNMLREKDEQIKALQRK